MGRASLKLEVGSWKLEVMRPWRDCRGEACLARRVRSTRIVIIRGIVVIGVRSTRMTDVAIIHSKTSFVGYRGQGMPRLYSLTP